MKTIIPDLNHYNEQIDWDRLQAQCPFVILRATCGTGTDRRYTEFVRECEVRRIPFHAYHYLKALNEEEARAEAKVFYTATGKLPAPLFYVIDCEYDEISRMAEKTPGFAKRMVEAFEEELRRLAGADIRIACYIGGNNYERWGLDYSRYVYIWIPRYGADDGKPHTQPEYACDLWQYTSNGRVDFVSDDVDLNQLTGTKPVEFFTGKEEADGMEKVFTAAKYVEWLREQAAKKRPYWYGVYYQECTEDLLQRKRRQYPKHYTDDRMPTYRKHIAAKQIAGDCVNGAIKGAVWSELGTRKPVYKSHDCPDRSADGMFEYCKSIGMDWGAINTMPDIPGIAVRMAGHVGVYVGDGEVVEWRGFAHGCVITKLDDRLWLHWYKMPWVDYENNSYEHDRFILDVGTLGSRLLKNGRKGEDVRTLQELLKLLGYDLSEHGSDGDFGSETERAVKAFQRDHGLDADGQYGKLSHAEMMETIAEYEDDDDDIVDSTEKTVSVIGNTVNVREGAGTQYGIITVVRKGQMFDHMATASNGWHAIRLEDKVGWISGKLTSIV